MARYLAPAASTSWLSAPETAARKSSAPQDSGNTRLLIYSRRSGLSPQVSDWVLSLTAVSAILILLDLVFALTGRLSFTIPGRNPHTVSR